VDEEAAAVVRRIYKLCIDGYGAEQTAGILQKDEVLKPTEYWKTKGVRKPGKKSSKESLLLVQNHHHKNPHIPRVHGRCGKLQNVFQIVQKQAAA